MNANSLYKDEELFSLISNNDIDAFAILYNRYWKRLIGIAIHKTGSTEDAEEIVQEVFADIWKRRHEIQLRHTVKSFLAGAVRYQVYSSLAKKYRKRVLMEDSQVDKADRITLDDYYDYKELKEQLEQAALKLPEKCQLVFKLSREAGLSHKEIAHHLNISEKTVENHLTKALKNLHAAIKSFLFFF